LVSHIQGGIYPQGLPELDAEENIWTYEGGGNYIMAGFMMCPPGQLKGSELSGTDNRLGREDK